MKHILIAFLLLPTAVVAQNDLTSTSSFTKDALQVEVYDATMKKIPYGSSEIEGSPMLNNHFVKGIVKFKTGQQYDNVALNLSLVSNQLYFVKDSITLQFLNPVDYFALAGGKQEKLQTFRSGYPSVDGNDENTFYQIVTDGAKVQLLKYLTKTVRDVYNYNSPSIKKYALKETLYVYDKKSRTIFELPTRKARLDDALPALAVYIDQFDAKNNLNLKHEDEVISMFDYVNAQ